MNSLLFENQQDPEEWPVIEALPSYGRGRERLGGRHISLIHGNGLTDVVITGKCNVNFSRLSRSVVDPTYFCLILGATILLLLPWCKHDLVWLDKISSQVQVSTNQIYFV